MSVNFGKLLGRFPVNCLILQHARKTNCIQQVRSVSFKKALSDFQRTFVENDLQDIHKVWKKALDRGLVVINILNENAIAAGKHRRDEWFVLDGDKKVITPNSPKEGEQFFKSHLA